MNKMKKILFIVIIFSSINIFGQKNIIKANPVSPFFKIYNIGFERETKEKQSISLSLYDYNFSNYDGFLINSEYRFYLSKKEGLRGFFIGPSVFYSKLESINGSDFDKEHIYALNVNLGQQFSLNSNLTFDYTFATGYLYYNEPLLSVFISFSLGYAF